MITVEEVAAEHADHRHHAVEQQGDQHEASTLGTIRRWIGDAQHPSRRSRGMVRAPMSAQIAEPPAPRHEQRGDHGLACWMIANTLAAPVNDWGAQLPGSNEPSCNAMTARRDGTSAWAGS